MAYLLVVDDDPDFALSIATVCQRLGHEVCTVHSPKDALARLQERRPDGILLDVIFPEDPAGGFQLAREICRRHGRVPILMLTAVNQQFPLGFSDKDIDDKWLPVAEFLEKPVDFQVLRDKITRLFAEPEAAAS